MKLYIDGAERDLGAVTFSELGYGKATGEPAVPFVLEVAADDFLQRFGPIYEDCVSELRRDDEITGEFSPPYPGANDYPRLDGLFALPADSRMEFIDTHFVFDILGMYLYEEAYEARTKWIIERCDSVEQSGDNIVIRGVARARAAVSGLTNQH